MSQIEVVFTYNGVNTTIQCEKNMKVKDIYQKFRNKVQAEDKVLYFMYNGKNIQNGELKLDDISNFEDKKRNKMNILVNELEGTQVQKKDQSECIVKSKEIICPKCQENIKINIKDYNICLFQCKNKHKLDLLFNEYDQTQNINLSKIVCQMCNNYNKGNVHNNVFYRCNNCKLNLCPICYSKHNKNHNTINYDNKNYICEIHNKIFIAYCENCQNNICLFCEQNHNNHNIIHFGKLIPNENKINNYLELLKEKIAQIKDQIKQIMKKLKNIMDNFDIYYNINENLIRGYNKEKISYERLYNINNIDKNNIIQDINNIINENNIITKFTKIIDIYDKMNYKNSISINQNMNNNTSDQFSKNYNNQININNINLLEMNLQNKNSYEFPCGLTKLGYTCHINSALQSLFNVKKLTDYLINLKDTILNLDMSLPLLKAYLKTILYLSRNVEGSQKISEFAPKNFVNVLKNEKEFNIDEDPDPYDIIRHFFQKIHEQIMPVYQDYSSVFTKYIINNPFLANNLPPNDIQNLNAAINTYAPHNKTIIANLFYFMKRSITKCSCCGWSASNFNVENSIVFALEDIRKWKFQNELKTSMNYNNMSMIGTNNNMNMNQNMNINYNMMMPFSFNSINNNMNFGNNISNNYYNNIQNNMLLNNFFPNKEQQKSVDLYDAFQHYKKDNFLGGQNKLYCQKCNNTCDQMQSNHFYTLPEYLVINLNRGEGNKYQVGITFPEFLDLTNEVQTNLECHKYRLICVITHLGPHGTCGNYITYCFLEDRNMWYKFDDSKVTESSFDEAKTSKPFDNYRIDPYILFYHRLNN